MTKKLVLAFFLTILWISPAWATKKIIHFSCEATLSFGGEKIPGVGHFLVYSIGISDLVGWYTDPDGKADVASSVMEIPWEEISNDNNFDDLISLVFPGISVDKIKTMIGWKIKFDTGDDGNEANFFELTTIDGKVLKGGVIGWGAIAVCHPPETSS